MSLESWRWTEQTQVTAANDWKKQKPREILADEQIWEYRQPAMLIYVS